MAASGVDILCLPGFTTASWLLFALPFPVSTLDQAHISFALLFPKETWDAHNFFFIPDPQHKKLSVIGTCMGCIFLGTCQLCLLCLLFNDLIFAVHFRFTKKKNGRKPCIDSSLYQVLSHFYFPKEQIFKSQTPGGNSFISLLQTAHRNAWTGQIGARGEEWDESNNTKIFTQTLGASQPLTCSIFKTAMQN